MNTNQIKKWVKEAIRKGYSNQEMVDLLKEEGYGENQISEVISVGDGLQNNLRPEFSKITKGITGKKKKELGGEEEREIAEIISKIKKEIAKIVVGQEEIIDAFICALLCNGHVLLEGVPGIAKTLIVKTLAEVSGCTSKRIQFTVDLLPSDIIGITTYTPEKGFETIKGPLFTNFVVADEINRSPPKTQSALIQGMQEKQVTIGKETFQLPLPFFVMANNNPIEVSGVYTLPEAQVDRFLFKLIIRYPKKDEEKKIMEDNITIKKLIIFVKSKSSLLRGGRNQRVSWTTLEPGLK